jgi:hypothetical protein
VRNIIFIVPKAYPERTCSYSYNFCITQVPYRINTIISFFIVTFRQVAVDIVNCERRAEVVLSGEAHYLFPMLFLKRGLSFYYGYIEFSLEVLEDPLDYFFFV